MRLIVVTPYYSPDLGPSAPLITMLCEDLTKLGHRVVVFSAVPHYPTGQVNESYRRRLWVWDEIKGVRICRVWVPSGNRSNLIFRLLVFLIYQLMVFLMSWWVGCDSIIITNPAIETFLPFTLFKMVRRKPILYCVWDLYPEVGIQAGIFKNKLAIWIITKLEDICLRQSSTIQAISLTISDQLVLRGIDPYKIKVIYPWVDSDFIQPKSRNNEFSRNYQLVDKFVVMYAGNMGHSQDLETIINAAELIQAHGTVLFVLVGDGPVKNKLQNMVIDKNLENVIFIPFRPWDDLPFVLASADIDLVSQKIGLEMGSFPSKIIPVLSSGRPVIVLADKESELAKIVSISEAGTQVQPGDYETLSQIIVEFYQSPQRCFQLGENGREYVIKTHSRKNAAIEVDKILNAFIV